MKKLLTSLLINLVLFTCSIESVVIKTDDIQVIKKEVSKETLLLFNIAEVLMDTEISLGTQAWRKYLRKRLDTKTHDELSLYVFKNVPPKVPDSSTPSLIQEMQEHGVSVFACTSRGRHEWYHTQVPDIDILTEKLLKAMHIDFSKTQLPQELYNIEQHFADYFHAGIIYTTNTLDKGDLLTQIFEKMKYKPQKIVFVDDKEESLRDVEEDMTRLGIEFVGFSYSRTAKEHESFDPMIAHIQLEALLDESKILSDQEAAEILEERYRDVDPETYFIQIIEKWNHLNPREREGLNMRKPL